MRDDLMILKGSEGRAVEEEEVYKDLDDKIHKVIIVENILLQRYSDGKKR